MINPGDYIQWECNGYAMFSEPRKVRELSPCKRFAFVDEETCGLPIQDCTKVVKEEKKEEKFTFFWNGPFSQWHICKFKVHGVEYCCAEQFMMAQKARLFLDFNSERTIMQVTDPADHKRLGRGVKGFIKDKWDAAAKDIVYDGNYAKFKQNPKLKQAIYKTAGTTLVEASPYDQIWGIGLRESDQRALKRETWKGKNWLGEVLTMVRDDLMREEEQWKKEANLT